MAATIQHIELPKKPRALDTSGNNNHGKIYSGRALEFDGVTDYFQHNGGESLAGVNEFDAGIPWTFACWIYFDSSTTNSTHYFVGEDNTSHPLLAFSIPQKKLQFRENTASLGKLYYDFPNGHGPSLSKMEEDTWHRIVVTTNGTYLTAYINGVHAGDITVGQADTSDTGTFSVTNMEFSGWGCPYQTAGNRLYHLKGMMSDGQVWDATWSADDAAYDFANPESLALNASGTALTEGNLKIWYPMQDGHRGQQSYILDGANTGLGSETSPQLNFDTDETGSWSGFTDTFDFDTDHYVLSRTSSDGRQRRVISPVPTVGTVYKVSVVAKRVSGSGVVRVGLTNSSDQQLDLTNFTPTSDFATYTSYVTAASDTTHAVLWVTSPNTVIHYKSLSIKAINDKNHATTVFYGDELVTNGTFESDTTGWTNSGGTNMVRHTSTPISGSGDLQWGQSSTSAGYTGFRQTNSTAITTGRTYVLAYTYRVVGTPDMFAKLGNGTGMDSDLLTGFTETALDATSNTSVSYTFTAGASGDYYLMFRTAENADAAIYVDGISLKEVGVASGWTDADQQLDIAQPALQSYNELAWFDGANDYVPISADVANFGTDDFTISAWVYINNESILDSERYIVMRRESSNKLWKIAYNYNTDKFIITIKDGAGGTDIIGHSADTALTASMQSKWHHIACSVDRDGYLNFYVNGSTIYGKSFDIADRSAVDIDNTGVFTIGASSGGGSSWFNGCITEVSIFDGIALSSAQVNELYNDGKALDATTHSQAASYLTGYWRNNGLSTWSNLDNPGTVDGTPTNFTETLLIPQGVDGSRDTQGFIMNRARNTSSLNLTKGAEESGIGAHGAFVGVSDDSTLDFGTGAFTIEAWVKYNYQFTGSVYNTIVSLGGHSTDVSYNTAAILTHNTPANGFFFYVDGVTVGTYIPSPALVKGDWYHVVGTRAADGEAKIYQDGELKITAADKGGTVTNALEKYIGRDSLGSRYYKEAIDGVKIYNKALSLAEVQRNYKATKGSHR